ncbi:MAG TPA: hypothetical protein VNA14_03415, partial [Mycobacteriales bacterium]|nr:hypothetical protein [Mycobacteriales bacterium]
SDVTSDVERERMLTRLRAARYVFAGPGSPTYALRQWADSPVPEVLRELLTTGGAVTFASAAALTLGVATVPVYEVYKVGEDPRWLPGLDLLSVTGLRAAVVPHYNNAEGGHHDTRFCYLGEPRLAAMEAELPDGAMVLGVDEHTAIVFDLDAGTATVHGLGVVTVRAGGRSAEVPAGSVLPIGELAALAGTGAAARLLAQRIDEEESADSPLSASIAGAGESFAAALAARDVTAALESALALEQQLEEWSRDSLQSDERDRGRALLRSMLVRLGDLATTGVADPKDAVAPYVDLLLELRTSARDDQRWADSDRVRDGLTAAGVEVRDTPAGVEWDLRPTPRSELPGT